jgi:hypothetical protein
VGYEVSATRLWNTGVVIEAVVLVVVVIVFVVVGDPIAWIVAPLWLVGAAWLVWTRPVSVAVGPEQITLAYLTGRRRVVPHERAVVMQRSQWWGGDVRLADRAQSWRRFPLQSRGIFTRRRRLLAALEHAGYPIFDDPDYGTS